MFEDAKISALPGIPDSIDNDLKSFLTAVKQWHDVREGIGINADDLARFISGYSLSNLTGVLIDSVSTEYGLSYSRLQTGEPAQVMEAPTGLTVVHGQWSFKLTWTDPAISNLNGIRVMAHTSNDVTAATSVGLVAPGTQHFDYRPADLTDDYYFWIRAEGFNTLAYSPWVGDGLGGGHVVYGYQSLDETISSIIDALAGMTPDAYNAGTTYYVGMHVTYDDRIYRCYDDDAGTGITGVAPDDTGPPAGTDHWVRDGILRQGTVDGVDMVGIEGELLIEGTVYAGAIQTGAIHVTHIGDTADIINPAGGVNICHPLYSDWDDVTALPTLTGSNGTAELSTTYAKFGTSSLRIYGSVDNMLRYFGTSDTDYNIFISPNKNWLLSVWINCPDVNDATGAGVLGVKVDGSFYGANYSVTPGGGWERVTVPVDLSYISATSALVYVNNRAYDGAGEVSVWYDGFMLEEQIGDNETPSAYCRPGGDVTSENTAYDIANLPATASGTGLFCTADYIGFYNGSSWAAYIKADGDFKFGGDANNYIEWDGSDFTIATNKDGGVTIKSGGGLKVEDGGGITIEDGGNFKVEDGGGITIEDGGGITIEDGGDLFLVSTASSTRSKIVFKKGTDILSSLAVDYDQQAVCFWPGSISGSTYFVVGADADSAVAPYDYIKNYANTRFEVTIKDGSDLYAYLFDKDNLRPSASGQTIDLGTNTFYWDDVYADDFNNVADFFWMDKRRENNEELDIDDLAVIHGILPSGIYDPHTGLMLIDDDTLPSWLVKKYKKDVYGPDKKKIAEKGAACLTPDGRPYLSLKTMISLCMGAIRQLDGKIADLHNDQ